MVQSHQTFKYYHATDFPKHLRAKGKKLSAGVANEWLDHLKNQFQRYLQEVTLVGIYKTMIQSSLARFNLLLTK